MARSRGKSQRTEDTASGKAKTARIVRSYSHDQKRDALAAMISTDAQHPFCSASIEAAYAVLGHKISNQTLHQWMLEMRSEITALIPQQSDREAVAQVYNETMNLWQEVRNKYLSHLADDFTVTMSNAREAGTVAGIAQDKLDKNRGLSAEILTDLQAIRAACDLGGYDLHAVLQDLHAHIMKRIQSRTIVIESPMPQNEATRGIEGGLSSDHDISIK